MIECSFKPKDILKGKASKKGDKITAMFFGAKTQFLVTAVFANGNFMAEPILKS